MEFCKRLTKDFMKRLRITCCNCKYSEIVTRYGMAMRICTLTNKELSRFTARHYHCDSFKLNENGTKINSKNNN